MRWTKQSKPLIAVSFQKLLLAIAVYVNEVAFDECGLEKAADKVETWL